MISFSCQRPHDSRKMCLRAMKDTCIVAHMFGIQIRVRRNVMAVVLSIAAWLALAGALRAGTLYVPNGSFELPVVTYAEVEATNMISWETFPAQSDGAIGVFVNNPAYTNLVPNEYIYNCNGNQAAYIFNDPGLALFQDYDAVDSAGTPSHAFGATFEVGKSYKLVTGFIGNTNFGETPGSTLQMSLYYRDSESNMITIAATNIVYDTNVFTSITNLVDFELDLQAVQATDSWAGQHIGIEFLSTSATNLAGGFWDLDNVRLSSSIYVPNASFELPVVTYAEVEATNMISWETFPPQSDGAIGVFVNNPAYTNIVPNEYIYNCNGNQAAYIFNDPELALFQDYDAVDSTGAQSVAFSATYQVGKSYQLVTGFIGNTNFGEMPGATLQMSLYYRDSSSNMVTIASTNIIYDTNLFTSITNLVDCELVSPTVQATDPWAGQHIGIEFLSTSATNLAGGFWDLDNVRLTDVLTPVLVNPGLTNGQFQATLLSEPGLVFQILATTDLTLPLADWTSLAVLTNSTGSIPFVDSTPGLAQRFYTMQPSP
jgi:hypothetical protein